MTASDERAAPAATSRSAAGSPSLAGKAWFWGPVVPLVALDLWSKAAAFAYVAAEAPRARRVDFDVLPEPFGFALVSYRNTGTIWGLGQELTIPLMVLRCAALVLIVWFAMRLPVARRLHQFVLGLIFAGAVGNLYDNFMMPDRGVRDFLLFSMRGSSGAEHVFPAFNVADSCITVGAILLLILLWREPAGDAPGGKA